MNIKTLLIKLFEKKIVRYGFIGGISTLTHISIAFSYLHFIADSIVFSNIFGFTGSFLFSYAVQSRYVFEHKISLVKAWRYLLVQITALILSILLAKYIPLNNYLRIIVIAFILPVITFFIHKMWTFSTPKGATDVGK